MAKLYKTLCDVHQGTRRRPRDEGTDTADGGHGKFALYDAVNSWEFTTNFLVVGMEAADSGHITFAFHDAIHTREKLVHRGKRHSACKSRAKLQEPATSSLVTQSGITDRAVERVPVLSLTERKQQRGISVVLPPTHACYFRRHFCVLSASSVLDGKAGRKAVRVSWRRGVHKRHPNILTFLATILSTPSVESARKKTFLERQKTSAP